jgi:hypothetical protein
MNSVPKVRVFLGTLTWDLLGASRPGGANDKSSALQRRANREFKGVPEGRLKMPALTMTPKLETIA